MIDLLIIAAPLLALAALYCAWRAGHMFLAWRPAVANVWKSGYSELEQQDDFWIGNPLMSLRGWNWRDGEDSRLIEDEIRFTDADGKCRVAMVERRVLRGWRPDGIYMIWYDPAHPERVTAFGPGYWLMVSLFCAAMLVSIFALGLRLAGAAG